MCISAWAERRGYKTAKAARNDVYRAANSLLRLAIDGRLCLCLRPLGYSCLKGKTGSCLLCFSSNKMLEVHSGLNFYKTHFFSFICDLQSTGKIMSTCQRLLLSKEEQQRKKEQENGTTMRMESPAPSQRRRETAMPTMMRMETMRTRGAEIGDKRTRTPPASLWTFLMFFGKTSVSERWRTLPIPLPQISFSSFFSPKPSFLSTISTLVSFSSAYLQKSSSFNRIYFPATYQQT